MFRLIRLLKEPEFRIAVIAEQGTVSTGISDSGVHQSMKGSGYGISDRYSMFGGSIPNKGSLRQGFDRVKDRNLVI